MQLNIPFLLLSIHALKKERPIAVESIISYLELDRCPLTDRYP